MSEIRLVEARLNDLVKSEEIWWAQRSRALWHGDKITKKFIKKLLRENLEIEQILYVTIMGKNLMMRKTLP